MSTEPGAIAVYSAELGERRRDVREFADATARLDGWLEIVGGMVSPAEIAAAGLPPTVTAGHADIAAARQIVATATERAVALAVALGASTDAYGHAEWERRRSIERIGSLIGGAAGPGIVRLLPFVAPIIATRTVARVVASGGPERLLSDRSTIDLIRAVTAGLDDAALAALGVPLPVLRALGDDGLGVVDSRQVVRAIIAVGPAIGLFRGTPVSTRRVRGERIDGGPRTFEDRIARIPKPAENGGGQIVVEKYSRPGEKPSYQVFISGTAEWDPRGGSNPFDLTSNLEQMAGAESGSLRAVKQALADAGADSSSRVVFVGHSQGALVAHALGASGEYDTRGVVEIGGPPVERRALPGVPDVVIEHTRDLVPALGGARPDDGTVYVTRDPFASGDVPRHETHVPAHDRDLYRETARLVDASDDPSLRAALRRMNEVSSGAADTERFTYHSERRG
jgi:hypothetical protein